MKAILLSNQSRSMSVFWRALIQAMRAKGISVACCAPPGDAASEKDLKALGARVLHYPLDRKGLNPLRDLQTLAALKRVFAAEKPDLLFATTIKPVIYGCLAGASAKIPKIYATITGLGYAFEADTPLKRLINRVSRAMYRAALSRANGVFFQNRDDSQLFQAQGILGADAPILHARGTGVDTDHFAQAPLPGGAPTFLLIGRLLEAKGIADFAEAARLLKGKYPDARFQVLGPPESGPGAVSAARMRAWQEQGLIEYLGEARDVRPYLAAAHVAVLPSWREGLPTALMEAMSAGRALVATDAPGCREVLRPGVDGFFCAVRDPGSLAAAMANFCADPALAARMGAASRRIAVEEFDAKAVAAGILKDMGA